MAIIDFEKIKQAYQGYNELAQTYFCDKTKLEVKQIPVMKKVLNSLPKQEKTILEDCFSLDVFSRNKPIKYSSNDLEKSLNS